MKTASILTRLVSALSVLALTTSLAACGGGATAGSNAGDGGTSDLTEANRIVDAAQSTAVIGPASGELNPEDIQVASADVITPTEWAARAGKPGKVITISCGSISPTCERQAQVELSMLQKLGWQGRKMSAGNDYTPESFQRSMTQAISEKPDVIITNGITGEFIGPQLAAAREAGIFTIATGPNEASGAGYDQYNPVGFTLSTSVMAAKMAVDMGGSGEVVWFNVPSFPYLGVPEGAAFGPKICSACSFKIQDTNSQRTNDPVMFGGLVTQTIQGNPRIKAIAMPGDTPMVAGRQAIDRSNNPDVQLYTDAFNASITRALNDGATPMMIGFPVAWSAVVSVDLALRHMLGEAPVPEGDITIGSMIMLPDQAPQGDIDEATVDRWSVQRFDYLAPYSRAWGVDLASTL